MFVIIFKKKLFPEKMEQARNEDEMHYSFQPCEDMHRNLSPYDVLDTWIEQARGVMRIEF
jgi:hypothetical protein